MIPPVNIQKYVFGFYATKITRQIIGRNVPHLLCRLERECICILDDILMEITVIVNLKRIIDKRDRLLFLLLYST